MEPTNNDKVDRDDHGTTACSGSTAQCGSCSQRYRSRVRSIRIIEAVCAVTLALCLSYVCLFALDRVSDTSRWLRTTLWVAAFGICSLGFMDRLSMGMAEPPTRASRAFSNRSYRGSAIICWVLSNWLMTNELVKAKHCAGAVFASRPSRPRRLCGQCASSTPSRVGIGCRMHVASGPASVGDFSRS